MVTMDIGSYGWSLGKENKYENEDELWKVERAKMQRMIKSEPIRREQVAEVLLKIYY